MDHIAYLKRMFEYNHWANREALAAINQADVPPEASMRLIGHIIAVERLWLHRLNGESDPVIVWPDLSIDECETQLGFLQQMWEDYLSDLSDEKLARSIHYSTVKGEAFDNHVHDVLVNTITHGSYHRGQIAAALRAAGVDPAYTDFIHAIREGYIK